MIVEVVKGSKFDNDDAAERVSSAINLMVEKFNLKTMIISYFMEPV